jgi:hypothetical protein
MVFGGPGWALSHPMIAGGATVGLWTQPGVKVSLLDTLC